MYLLADKPCMEDCANKIVDDFLQYHREYTVDIHELDEDSKQKTAEEKLKLLFLQVLASDIKLLGGDRHKTEHLEAFGEWLEPLRANMMGLLEEVSKTDGKTDPGGIAQIDRCRYYTHILANRCNFYSDPGYLT